MVTKPLRVGFACDHALLAGLKELSRREQRPVSDVVRRLVQERIAKLKLRPARERRSEPEACMS